MTPDELQATLLTIGISSRIQRNEVLIETCRFCGNTRWNLELNAIKGIYHCWACDAGGRLDVLLTSWLGEPIHIPVQQHSGREITTTPLPPKQFTTKPVTEVSAASRFLHRRGITTEQIKRYEMLVCTEPGHRLENRLIIPLRDFWTNELLGYIGRSITNRIPKYLSTLATRMITGYRVRSWTAPCIIVEGIFDAIAVHSAGFHAAMLSGTSNAHIVDFASRLPPETPTTIMLDGEATAQAERLFWTLYPIRAGHNPPIVVSLPPGLDPADFLPTTLQALVKAHYDKSGST